MTFIDQFAFERRLRARLRGTRRVAVVGIGDELSPHDRLGMLAAREIEGLHLPTIKVFFAGTVPESVTAPVRRYKPDHTILLDAADMAARPGTVAIVRAADVQARLFSTHALPLSVVMQFLEEDTKAPVTLIGIQPDTRAHESAPSALEEAGLTRLLVSVFRIMAQPRGKSQGPAKRSHAL